MKNAFEFREEFTPEGKLLKREAAAGPALIAGIVAVVSIIMGVSLDVPAVFWKIFK